MIHIDCSEHFGDIAKVYAIPLSQVSCSVPLGVKLPGVTLANLSISNLDTFLASHSCFSCMHPDDGPTGNAMVFMIDAKPTVKSTSDRTTSGITYTVSVTIKLEYTNIGLRTLISVIQASEHHLILVTSAGDILFVRCLENAYKCTSDENIAASDEHTITFELRNTNGVQYLL